MRPLSKCEKFLKERLVLSVFLEIDAAFISSQTSIHCYCFWTTYFHLQNWILLHFIAYVAVLLFYCAALLPVQYNSQVYLNSTAFHADNVCIDTVLELQKLQDTSNIATFLLERIQYETRFPVSVLPILKMESMQSALWTSNSAVLVEKCILQNYKQCCSNGCILFICAKAHCPGEVELPSTTIYFAFWTGHGNGTCSRKAFKSLEHP